MIGKVAAAVVASTALGWTEPPDKTGPSPRTPTPAPAVVPESPALPPARGADAELKEALETQHRMRKEGMQEPLKAQMVAEAIVAANNVIYPSTDGPTRGVVTDAKLASLLERKFEIELVDVSREVLSRVAAFTMRDLIFSDSLDPQKPSDTLAPVAAADSKPFKAAYWEKFIKGTAAEKTIASPEKLTAQVLKDHLKGSPEILKSLTGGAEEAQTAQRDMLARMMKYSAPLQSGEIEQKMMVPFTADSHLVKAHELLRREVPADNEGRIQLVRDIAAELKQLPEGRTRSLAIAQAEVEIQKFGELAPALLRGEIAPEVQLSSAERVDKAVLAIEGLQAAKKQDSKLDVSQEIEQHRKAIADEIAKHVKPGKENHEANGAKLKAEGLLSRERYLKVREVAGIEIQRVAKGIELDEKALQTSEGWKPQLKSQEQVPNNNLQVVAAVVTLVGPDPHKPNTQAIAAMLRSLPERLRPIDPNSADIPLEKEKSEREYQMGMIRDQLRDRLAEVDRSYDRALRKQKIKVDPNAPTAAENLLAQASPEDRKVIAPYILGNDAAADAARIKEAIEAAKADPKADPKAVVMGVLREIKSEVELHRQRGESARKIARERATDAVYYYNHIEKDPAAPVIHPALDKI